MSVNILEKFISGADKKTCMPAVSCLGSVSDNGSSVGHNWENAVDVDPTEMSCQVVLVSMYYFICCTAFRNLLHFQLVTDYYIADKYW